MSDLIQSGTAPYKDTFTATFRNRVYWVFASFHFKGLEGSIRHYCQRLPGLLAGKPGSPLGYQPSLCSDQFAAVPMANRVDELAMQGRNAKWGVRYDPSPEGLFREIVAALPLRLTDYNFIDLGAGKGWVLILASEYPFKRIIGVEYSKMLVDAANNNIRSQRRLTGSQVNAQCIWGDAADFEIPLEPTVLYLFNPFQGKVMDRVIANIEHSLASTPRDLWVIYLSPWEIRKFRRSPTFETIEWKPEYSIHRAKKSVARVLDRPAHRV